MRSFGPSDFVLVLSETVLEIVIEKQLWLTNWVLDPCGIFNSLVAQTLSEGLRVRAGVRARARRLPVASTPSHNNS
jgi:hypothetical protein